jgi:hypothetical protein
MNWALFWNKLYQCCCCVSFASEYTNMPNLKSLHISMSTTEAIITQHFVYVLSGNINCTHIGDTLMIYVPHKMLWRQGQPKTTINPHTCCHVEVRSRPVHIIVSMHAQVCM